MKVADEPKWPEENGVPGNSLWGRGPLPDAEYVKAVDIRNVYRTYGGVANDVYRTYFVCIVHKTMSAEYIY